MEISRIEDNIVIKNCIDDNIIELLEQRFNLVVEIGQYKKENNLPVFDAKRESAIKQKFTTKKYQDSKTIQYDKEHNN